MSPDSVDMAGPGLTEQFALRDDGAELLAFVEDATGDQPVVTDIEDPWGNGELWGHRYEWDEVRISVIRDSTNIAFLAPSVGGFEVVTGDGIAVGSSRADVIAAGGADRWDEDGDGIADYIALEAVEVPDTRSLERAGEVGIDFIEVSMSGDTVSAIRVPANDYSDI